ncbi:redoxin domain-containing protein [Streptosporangium amethystogenes]|uniref:redoxin domain-containing protein n=1 Tax=Streptosporangium amethystogenes TaxID=2002 RepID=UPI0037B63CF3
MGRIITRLTSGRGSGPGANLLEAGTTIEPFSADTTDGRTVFSKDYNGRILVAFFLENCPPCKDAVPQFADSAQRNTSDMRYLSVISCEGKNSLSADTQAHIALLEGSTEVFLESPGGPIHNSFRTQSFPSFYLLTSKGGLWMIEQTFASVQSVDMTSDTDTRGEKAVR